MGHVLEIDRLSKTMDAEAARTGLPFPALPEIPAGRYTDAAHHALEVDALRRTWQFVLHDDELPQPGSLRALDHLGVPLLVVRDEGGTVRAFRNTCRHRGSQLVVEPCAQREKLSCPIHGWTYRLDGRLAGVRDRRDFDEADLTGRSLIGVRCESIGRLWFVNLDAAARALVEDFGPLAEAWSLYRPGESRLVSRTTIRVDANYKIVQEANLEVYHVNSVHPAIVASLLDSSAAPITLLPNGHSIQAARLRKADFTEAAIDLAPAPEASPVTGIANVAFNVFPSLVIATNDWGYPLLCFRPVDVRTTDCEVIWIGHGPAQPDKAPVWDMIQSTFRTVLEQDFVFCPRTQASLASGAIPGLLMGAQEKAIYHFHEEMDRRIGADRMDPRLRVEPRLGAYVVNAF
ncbi:MAG TPA: aromatic ring-hydroxylating dioxygenase subunit alpha [Nevskiaceae bacterium]|nr:aromatic ring-hydroxylating dioxygenase subunit alpha [Nevskiaceae bacterium]